jgi:dienelactone hydrolase
MQCPSSVPAWTLNGQPIPYTTFIPGVHPANAQASVIPVEKIRGPIFLDCGGDDLVWPSCPATKAIAARLRKFHHKARLLVAAYPTAGHGVGALVPHEPTYTGTDTRLINLQGVTPTANSLALASLWPRLIAFLKQYR